MEFSNLKYSLFNHKILLEFNIKKIEKKYFYEIYYYND